MTTGHYVGLFNLRHVMALMGPHKRTARVYATFATHDGILRLLILLAPLAAGFDWQISPAAMKVSSLFFFDERLNEFHFRRHFFLPQCAPELEENHTGSVVRLSSLFCGHFPKSAESCPT